MREAKPIVQNAHLDILSKNVAFARPAGTRMTDIGRTFRVASDDRLVELIRGARRRLVIVCPAVTEAVAQAIADRLKQGFESATVILDTDPEVYRLGYGTEAGFDLLRAASKTNLLDLREQQGVRIGVVIADDVAMVFFPVPLLIEAGSKTEEKPNAIVFSGTAVERLAEAAGAGAAEAAERQEVGTTALIPAAAEALKADLKNSPPQQFDVARALRVFTSKIQYVEIEVENYRLSSRQVQMPEELLDITDDQLRDRISGRLRTPTEALGPFEILIETKDGRAVVKADERWVGRERKRIEDEYTYIVPHYGRVIFRRDKDAFSTEIERFQRNVDEYCWAARKALSDIKSEFKKRLVTEYLPRWQQNPPRSFARHRVLPTEENLGAELDHKIGKMIDEALSFQAPRVRVIHKDIAVQSIQNEEFRTPLEKAMRRRGVPVSEITSLFAIGDAAPARTSFEVV
jgi:hypothetical protein